RRSTNFSSFAQAALESRSLTVKSHTWNEAPSLAKSFLAERPATATVIAEGAVRVLAFERGKLGQFFHKEAEVAGLIYQLLGRDLAHKIKVSNRLLSAGNSSP